MKTELIHVSKKLCMYYNKIITFVLFLFAILDRTEKRLLCKIWEIFISPVPLNCVPLNNYKLIFFTWNVTENHIFITV